MAPARAFLAAAARPEDLLTSLDDAAAVCAGSSLLDVGSDAVGAGPLRLAIADPTPPRLALARTVVARGTPWRGRNDVWFAPSGLLDGGGKVALAFPGLEPIPAPDVDRVAAHFGITGPPGDEAATGIGQHAMAAVRAGRVLAEALARLGIDADVTAGHSLGEWTAMIVSGAVPAAAVDAFAGGVLALPDLALPDLVFLAVGCSAEVARRAIAGLPDIVLSHDNCPHQAILCGRATSIAAARERLRERQRVLCQELPFRTGLHTPMFADYLAPFAQRLGGELPLTAPQIPLWSSITARPFPADPAGVRDVATRLYTEPVRFRQLVENLYADGVRVFVQPGVGSVTGFVDDTLHGHEHLAIAAALADRPGLAQLTRVAAALWVEGADIRFERLVAPTLTATTAATTSTSTSTSTTTPSIATPRAAQGSLPGPTGAASTHPVPPASVRAGTQRRVLSLSLDTMPELADHAFFRQPDGVGTAGDRFPVVPMALLVELFVDAAQRLAPQRVVVGLENVRAQRWLAVEPPTDVTISAEYCGPERIEVTLESYARAVVRLGDTYPPPRRPDRRPLQDERPAPHSAAALYGERLMFHGPAYRGVRDIARLGDDGVRGAIEALPAPGALLDAAGQLAGYWVMVSTAKDQIARPTRIDRIDFFAPPPPTGTRCEVTVRLTELTPSEAQADVEVLRDGTLWARMAGFTERRFDTDAALLRVMQFPEDNGLAVRDTARGTYVVRKHWQSVATRELIMRRYLGESERAEYNALSALAQGPWLLGRIALKDAVRGWLWDQGAGPIYPIHIQVDVDDRGEPRVRGPGGSRPHVSLSLRDGEAVVVVGDESSATTPANTPLYQATYT